MGKKKYNSVVWLFPFTWVLHPFCISLDMFFSRGEWVCNAEIRAPLFKTPWKFRGGQSCEVALCRGGNKLLRLVPFWSAKQILGLKRDFNPDSLSTWSSAPIYFLYRQASVKTLPRFEEMFDTIVSSSSTFNYWSENLFPSESCLTFFNLCHLLFKFPSNLVSSDGRIKLSHFLGMHRLCDKIYKQFWSSVKFTAT